MISGFRSKFHIYKEILFIETLLYNLTLGHLKCQVYRITLES